MSELAFNLNGDPFEIPASAVAWRTRKMKAKGAPEVAYGRNGQPLVLPIDADMDDLRAEVNTPGRYRLDPIDAANKLIDGAPAGYVYVHELLAPVPATPTTVPTAAGLTPLPTASDNVAIEAMRMTAEIARTVVANFPMMLESSAVLVRAADGAGLPARPGMVVVEDEDDEEDDDDEDDDTKGSGLDIGALLVQFAPVLMALTGGKLKLPDILNWNKAAEKGAASRKEAARATEAPTATSAATASTASPAGVPATSEPAIGLHVMAVLSALTPAEAELARATAMELSAEDRAAWFNTLKTMTVADATAKVRGELARLGKKGDAS